MILSRNDLLAIVYFLYYRTEEAAGSKTEHLISLFQEVKDLSELVPDYSLGSGTVTDQMILVICQDLASCWGECHDGATAVRIFDFLIQVLTGQEDGIWERVIARIDCSDCPTGVIVAAFSRVYEEFNREDFPNRRVTKTLINLLATGWVVKLFPDHILCLMEKNRNTTRAQYQQEIKEIKWRQEFEVFKEKLTKILLELLPGAAWSFDDIIPMSHFTLSCYMRDSKEDARDLAIKMSDDLSSVEMLSSESEDLERLEILTVTVCVFTGNDSHNKEEFALI